MSYGAITVTVNVAANATSPQVNTASVFTATGGGAASATASDSTIISSQVSVPNVVGDTQAAATTAITGAGLVVGTVTTAYQQHGGIRRCDQRKPGCGNDGGLGIGSESGGVHRSGALRQSYP